MKSGQDLSEWNYKTLLQEILRPKLTETYHVINLEDFEKIFNSPQTDL